MSEVEFRDTPLGNHMIRNRHNKNFIDKVNNFWIWQADPRRWYEMGCPDPFDDDDISVAHFMRVNLEITHGG